MMMTDSSLLSIPVPSMITSSLSGGRFDFDDGGTYCGGWQDNKAHGYGVCTGPKNIGEYSGSWNFGFEMSGVYKWKNGAVYEGRWQNGKRHGVGVEYNGKWIYKGEWSQGFKGRYGVKASSNSAVKYEGTWANGLQDGYGSETYSDGGYYQGQMCRGLRHGYGVRKSAPYGDSQLNNPNKNGQQQLVGGASSMLIHSNSLQSSASVDLDDDSPKLEDGFKPNIDRSLASKNGFVLVAKPLDVPMHSISSPSPTPSNSGGAGNREEKSRRNSLTGRLVSGARIPGSSNQTAMSLLRGLRLKKQKSTSDLESLTAVTARGGGGISSRSSGGNVAIVGDDSSIPAIPFSLSPEELDITDPTAVETYTGEWKHDKRNGHGVCERSDGLKYEGQWHNDMKCGYGVTTFKNKTKEEGKYKNNILIADSKVKRFFHLGGSNMRQRIDDSVKMAQQAQTMALKKAEIADTRAATARDKAIQAQTAAIEAEKASQIAFSVANQYSLDPQQQQQQLQHQHNHHHHHQQQQQQQQLAAMTFQQNQPMMIPGMIPSINAGPYGKEGAQMGPLNMAQNSLQLRRISQQQQRFNQMAPVDNAAAGLLSADQQVLQQDNQQQQFDSQLAGRAFSQLVEPFNGRRGSFRGTATNSSSQPSSGYQSAFASRSTAASQTTTNTNNPSILNQQLKPSSLIMGRQANNFRQLYNQSSTASDPFNDLFDHYKSSATTTSSPYSLLSRVAGNPMRRMPGKQASLDHQSSLRASVPRQFGPGSDASSSGGGGGDMMVSNQERLRRFRMSSMDHAGENAATLVDPITGNPAAASSSSSFKYLITSGEDRSNQEIDPNDNPNQANNNMAPTPTGSASYVQGGGSSLAGSSNFGGQGNQTSTPSPDAQSRSQHNQNKQPLQQQQPINNNQLQQQQQQQQQQYYAKQQAQRASVAAAAAASVMYNNNNNNNNNNMGQYPMEQDYHHEHHHHQRDVQSLADEQLYMAAGRRALELQHHLQHQQHLQDILHPSEYSKYDFTISNTPRLSRRCMRRTNSLSRNTPIRSSSSGPQIENSISKNNNNNNNRSSNNQLSRATSRQKLIQQIQRHFQQDLQKSATSIVITPSPWNQQQHQQQISTFKNNYDNNDAANINLQITTTTNNDLLGGTDFANSSHLTINSGSSGASGSSAGLIRKPSLQVRYDLLELGGLMSREEVAALSHAQREQKRLEAEMAEKRVKQPFLHLYLSLKEFLIRQQLIICVLLVNTFLLRTFIVWFD